MLTLTIRRARPDEAEGLTQIAVRSKGHWGYDAAFMERVREEMVVTPEVVAADTFRLLEEDGVGVGFYGLRVEGTTGQLTNLWVVPEAIGRGFGRELWEDAVTQARALGLQHFDIQADPHAEGFYLSRGATRIGEFPSVLIPGRRLPLLRYQVEIGDYGNS